MLQKLAFRKTTETEQLHWHDWFTSLFIKVARVVKLKLAYNQVVQNSLPKFRIESSSIISEKPRYLSEKLKTFTSSNYHKV